MGDRITTSRRALLRAGALGASLAATAPALAGKIPGAPGTPQVRRYVTLGRTGLEVADIGFGSSRLRDGQERLVEHAMARGINYFDTAEGYTDGAAERVIGKAIRGKRDQVILATKMFAGTDTSRQTMMATLDDSLRRLGSDHVDIFFNHAVNDVDRLRNDEWFEFVAQASKQGKFRFAGLSGHAGRLVECIDHGLDEDMLDVILVGYNFGQDPAFYEAFTRSFDLVANQPDLPRVLARAHRQGVGTIAMKVLRGARLNDMRPYETGGHTYAQAAFRWALSNPDIDATIVSMTSVELIDEYLGASGSVVASAEDRRLLEHYAQLNGDTFCRHACNQCEGACPYGVPISDVLRTRMYAVDYRDVQFARDEYAMLAVNASACAGCSGAPCQGACPHGLSIHALCRPVHGMLS